MAPSSPPPAGNPAGGPPAPPLLSPTSFARLLTRDSARATAILAAMRPTARLRQAQAHAALSGSPVECIVQQWAALISSSAPILPRTPPLERGDEPASVSVYDPEMLADLLVVHPKLAHELLARISEPQRVTQALAQAAWLCAHGLPVTLDEVLASWRAGEVRDAAA